MTMSKVPSLLRSAVRGDDWDPITGKLLSQTMLLFFCDPVKSQPLKVNKISISRMATGPLKFILHGNNLRKKCRPKNVIAIYFINVNPSVIPLMYPTFGGTFNDGFCNRLPGMHLVSISCPCYGGI